MQLARLTLAIDSVPVENTICDIRCLLNFDYIQSLRQGVNCARRDKEYITNLHLYTVQNLGQTVLIDSSQILLACDRGILETYIECSTRLANMA